MKSLESDWETPFNYKKIFKLSNKFFICIRVVFLMSSFLWRCYLLYEVVFSYDDGWMLLRACDYSIKVVCIIHELNIIKWFNHHHSIKRALYEEETFTAHWISDCISARQMKNWVSYSFNVVKRLIYPKDKK